MTQDGGDRLPSLAEELAERSKQGPRPWADPERRRRVYARAAEALKSSGIAESALREGQRAPLFELPDATGEEVRLQELLRRGPVILSFYRGQWCPFCNLELRALERALADVEDAGATLVAVSPNRPDISRDLVDDLGLSYPVLSDLDNRVAKQFGIVFEMIPEHVELYRENGRDIGAMNGTEAWELPIPATYVIDEEGVIRYAFVDADHHKRAEPAEVVEVAARLSGRHSAR